MQKAPFIIAQYHLLVGDTTYAQIRYVQSLPPLGCLITTAGHTFQVHTREQNLDAEEEERETVFAQLHEVHSNKNIPQIKKDLKKAKWVEIQSKT